MNVFIRTFLRCLSQYFSTNILLAYPVHQRVHEMELKKFVSTFDWLHEQI